MWTYNISVAGRVTVTGTLHVVADFFKEYPGDYWQLSSASPTHICFENWDNGEKVWFYHCATDNARQRRMIYSEDLF